MTEVTDGSELMRPSEVAKLFGVDAKTVGRWAKQRRLTATRTLGNQRRYYRDEVMDLLNGSRVDRKVEEEK